MSIAVLEAKTETPIQEGEELQTPTTTPVEPIIPTEPVEPVVEPKKIEITDDELTALLRERKILTEDSTLEALKPKIEKTQEEIIAEKNVQNKELLDEYVNSITDNSVTYQEKLNNYTQLNNLTTADDLELGLAIVKQQYKDAGYSAEKVEEIMQKRHFQLTDEQLDELELDEEEIAQYKKDRTYYQAKAAEIGSQMKNTATSTLNKLQQNIEAKKVETEIENSILGELDNFASSNPKLELKEIESGTDAFKFDALSIEYSKEEIAEVVSQLKDPSTRNKIFYKQDNQAENVTFVAELMLRANKAEKAYQEGLLKGGNAVNDYYKNTYLSDKNIQVRQQQAPQEQGKQKQDDYLGFRPKK